MLAIGVTALVAIVVGIALTTGFLTPPGSPVSTTGPVASLRTVLRSASVADMVVDNGTGWAVQDQTGSIRSFDPSSGAWTGRPIHVGSYPAAVTAGYGKLWVADSVGNDVVVVDPATGRRVGTPISVGQGPVSLAAGEGGVWVASLGADTVSLIDPKSRTVTATVALPPDVGAVRVTLGAGGVWVTGTTDTLTRLSPKPVGVSLDWKAVRVGQGPIGLAVASGAVWTGDALDGTITKVDTSTLRVVGHYSVGGDPAHVAVFDGVVWVGDGVSGSLIAVDPSTGRQIGTAVHLRGPVRGLLVSDGSLWAVTANPGSVVAISPN
jgi:YVTN family beta-propeller protein